MKTKWWPLLTQDIFFCFLLGWFPFIFVGVRKGKHALYRKILCYLLLSKPDASSAEKKLKKGLPHISQYSLPISKYPTKEAVLEFLCHILKSSLRICSFWQGNLCERTVKHTRHLKKITLIEQDGFKANPTNWASWLLRQILLLVTRRQWMRLVAEGIFLN